jgi:hypothetical protein
MVERAGSIWLGKLDVSTAEDITADVHESLKQARSAQVAYCEALTEFEVACMANDDILIETCRAKVLACAESFLEHHAAAYRRMRDAAKG